jgi:Tol biopolymer transport system component
LLCRIPGAILESVRELWRRIGTFSIAATLLLAAPLAIVLRAGIAGAATPARLAFVGIDDNIYECAGDCARPVCLTFPVHGTEARAGAIRPAQFDEPEQNPAIDFGWPTYSPNGRKIAYFSSGAKQGRPVFGVYVYDLDERLPTRIFESSTENAIYSFWLPDGRLSFLVTEPDDKLSLMLAEVREGAPIRIVATGAPIYFDWNHKTSELLLHTTLTGSPRTERVSLMSLTPTGQDVERVLAQGYSPFKTPCWSPDGTHLAFVASADDIAHLYVADADGRNPKERTKLMVGESSFVWAPDSRHIAFSTAQLPPHTVMDGINLLDLGDGSVKRLVNSDVAAFYFSPDAKQIAWVGAPSEQPFYTWNVINLRSGKNRRLGDFLTTNEETLAWHYFEQLALSHRIWAPDSSAIVFAGLPVTKHPGATLPEQPLEAPPPGIMIIPVNGAAPRRVADGVIAFWAPAPVATAPVVTAPAPAAPAK